MKEKEFWYIFTTRREEMLKEIEEREGVTRNGERREEREGKGWGERSVKDKECRKVEKGV